MAEAKVLACYVIGYALLWVPARLAVRRLGLDRVAAAEAADLWALAIAAGTGYLTFWIFLVHRVVGLVWACLLLAAAVASVWRVWRRGVGVSELWSRPARLALALGLLYLSLATLYGGLGRVPANFPDSFLDPPSLGFWFTSRAGDDLIPLKFASAVAHGAPLRGVATNFFGWQFSDRPPLQTGLLLGCWPLTWLFGPAAVGLAVGTVLQVQWVVGLAAVAAALGVNRRRTNLLLLVAATTGCVYFNTVYVWPKLLSAALFCAAAAVLARAWCERRSLDRAETALAAASATLALLAHGTIAFSLLALALMAVAYRPFRRWQTWLPAGLLALAIYAPWLGYQRYVDPPGDRCVKWMLAGHVPADDLTLAESLRASYGRLTLEQWLGDRWAGLRKVVGDPNYDHDTLACARALWGRWTGQAGTEPAFRMPWCQPGPITCDVRTLAALVRYDQVDQLMRALGVLNLAWPVVGWMLLRRATGRRALATLLGFAVLNVGVWTGLILLPEMFTIRNGSYALLLSLIALLALAICGLPRRLRNAMFALHVLTNVAVWGLLVPHPLSRNWGLAIRPHVVPILVAGGALWLIVRQYRRHAVAYRGRRLDPVGDIAVGPAWGYAAVVLAVGLVAVAVKSPLAAMSRWECVAPGGIIVRPTGAELDNAGMLFDGVRSRRANFASWPADQPLELRFREPQTLAQITVYPYHPDTRQFTFRVEGLTDGAWTTLYDGRSRTTFEAVVVPCPALPLRAIRITGACPNDPNVPDRAMQIEELELIRPAAAVR
jgi:hypothetical protein